MKYWDGTESLDFVADYGGGPMVTRGDCVTRAIAIAGEMPYDYIYDALSRGTRTQRVTAGSRRNTSARNGVSVRRKWFRDAMETWGFRWTPTMSIGSGCKVHLLKGELPAGRLVVSLSKHYTAVVDGVIHDTYDPTRADLAFTDGERRLIHRCVYGYWTAEGLT